MQINTDVYGLPSSWESYDSQPDRASVKVPHWGSDSNRKKWYNGFLQGNLILNEPIDLSLAHWGINGKSGLATKKFFLPYGTADSSTITDLKTGTLDVYRDNGKTFPAIFQYRSAQTGELYMTNPNYQYAYNAQSAVSNGLYGVPILDFEYNKVIVLPEIVCGYENPLQTGGFTVRSCTIREYFDTYQETYPYILQIRINSSGIFYGQIDENYTTRARTNYGAICQCDTRDKIGYPYMYNGVASENRINFLDLLPYSMTICGIDNNNTPPYWGPINFPQNTTMSLNDMFAMVSISNNHARFMCDNGKFQLKATNSNRSSYITAYWEDATEEEVLKEVAYLGFWFADNSTSAERSASGQSCTDDGLYLPKFDSDGVTTGEYWQGEEAGENAPDDDKTPRELYNYDPNAGGEVETEDYGDIENLGSARGVLPSGVNIYLMSRLDYNAFMSELNSYYANSAPDDWTLDFQGVNPSDYILNVYYTPYNFVKSENKSAVKIGNIELTTTAYELSEGQPGIDDPNKWKYFTYGTRKVTPLFNDFRDYDPFTKVELYLPLAGTIELETNYVMNHNITVEYYFDLMTMSGVAAVYRDSMLYKSSDFKLGAQVPLLTTNMGQIQNQITQLEFSQKQNNLRLATSAISSGVSIGSILAGGGEVSTGQAIGAAGGSFALASGIMKADEIDYQLKHTSPSVSVTGAAEPLNNYSVGQLTPKLIIKRPLMLSSLDDEVYSKTIGNSCCINTTLSSMTGLVVCSAIDTTGIQKEISTDVYISPTIDEVNMIKSTFNSGVIL